MKRIILITITALLMWGGVCWGADTTATVTYNMYNRNGTYTTARDAVSATNNSSGGARVGQNTSFDVIRGYLEFPIPALSSVASCSLFMYGDTDNSTTDFVVDLFTGSWASTATTEWDQFDGWVSGSAFTGTNLTDGWNTSGFSVGWNEIVLNAAGRAAILAAQGTTIKIAVISANDVSRAQPSGDEYVSFESKAAVGKEPYLSITEMAASTPTMTGVSISGVSVN